MTSFSPIPEILDELRAGRMVVLVDDENRENEGDLVCAAERVTPEIINFMTRHTPGYLCVALTAADCDRLELHPQTPSNTALRGTAMAVSVDGHSRKRRADLLLGTSGDDEGREVLAYRGLRNDASKAPLSLSNTSMLAGVA